MMMSTSTMPPQHQDKQPGSQLQMNPQPQIKNTEYKSAGKLAGKVALITGGDSGIGQAVAYLYAKEGAQVAISYLDEHEDAERCATMLKEEGITPLMLPGDIRNPSHCKELVNKTVAAFGKLDILICNAAQHYPKESIEDITPQQLEQTMQVNVYAPFYLIKEATPFLKEGSSIIVTASVVAYKGSPKLTDYAATKGALVAMIYSLSEQLVERKIRVNGVAPGPIWTPLIPSSFDEKKVSEFGADTPMGRPGQPCEVAPAYVFLASEADASYISGQVIHVNGGRIIGS